MQHRTEIIHARCTAKEKAALVAFAKRERCSLTQAVMRLIQGGGPKDGTEALTAYTDRPAAEKRHADSRQLGHGRS